MRRSKIVVWAVVAVLVGGALFALTRSGLPPTGDIDNSGLRRLVADGARLVDVRTPGEYEAGHIPDAENVPIDGFGDVARRWDRTRPVVVYCATGARSANAAQWMIANGFEKVYNLAGGIVQWDGELSRQAPSGAMRLDPPTDGIPAMLEFSSGG